MLFFTLQVAAQNNHTFSDLFPVAELPYQSPVDFYSFQYDEVEDPEQHTGYKLIDINSFPELKDFLNEEDALVFAVNQLKLNENTLYVLYVNTYSKITGDEVNYYKGVLFDKEGEIASDILLSDSFYTMASSSTFETNATTSTIDFDPYSEDILVEIISTTTQSQPDVSYGVKYKEVITTYWKIYSNADIQDVTNYWK